MDLMDSKTKENLMRAFAGESQARNRYTFAAKLAEEAGHYGLKQLFEMTADQEKEHGEVFFHLLKQFDGQNLPVEAEYPVSTSKDLLTQLQEAVHNELEEAERIYPEFGDIALREGFNKAAGKFFLIAEIEKMHSQRFAQMAEWLKAGKLYVSDVQTGWVCMECGNVVESTTAPQNCPVCDAPQEYFIRFCLSPYNIKNCKSE